MSSFLYDHAQTLLLEGSLDLTTEILKVILVMTNTSVDTEQDAELLSDFTTLDEYDGAEYSRETLLQPHIDMYDAANTAVFVVNGFAYGSLGPGTRSAQGLLVYSDASELPVAYIDVPTFNGDGSTIEFVWEFGLLHLVDE